MNVAISTSAVILAKAVDARVILISSESGYTARMVSRLRPEFSLCVATHSKKVMRQMNLIWGVQPFVVADSGKLDDIFKRSISLLGKRGVVRQNDKIVIVSTQRAEMKNAQNWVKILRID
jgi:pyruvate kinase